MKIGSVLTGMLLVSGLVAGAIPQTERDALIALYNSTDGANWIDNTNWRNAGDTDFNDPGTECTWYGLECDAGNTMVVYIEINYNNLSGSIPPELGNLSNLVILQLESNQLSGTIPTELGDLTSLWSLILIRNQLSGTIPTELGNLTNLGSLWLYSNQLSGSIPPELGNLTNLGGLGLDFNQLSGSIPSELWDLTSLGYLDLASNQLSGSIPPELWDLTDLQHLDLSSNQLSGSIPPEVGDLTDLQHLDLSSIQLSGSIPPELGDLTDLQRLDLSSNQLSGSIPSELENLTDLQRLDLSSNHLSGSIPSELENLSSLQRLWLYSNQLSGSIPTELRNLNNLSNTDIGYNALWTDDAELQAFLDIKDPDWDETQTIAPEGLTIVSVADHTVWLDWTPIMYTDDAGGYEVFSEPVVTKAPTSGGFTLTKTTTTFPVTGLLPGQSYDFTVGAFTYPHDDNQNTVESELTAPEMATTSDLGCSEPIVESGSGLPRTLTVVSSSIGNVFEWSTGETTPSITVNPSVSTYYWVRVFGPGSCDEATVVYVPIEVFADGFESGDTSGWSSHVP